MQCLMRITDVAAYLSTTPGAARNWLRRMGVPDIDLGRGRGLGLRWSPLDVESALLKMRESAKPKPKPKLPTQRLIVGRTTAEILADLGLTENSPKQ